MLEWGGSHKRKRTMMPPTFTVPSLQISDVERHARVEVLPDDQDLAANGNSEMGTGRLGKTNGNKVLEVSCGF